MYDFGHLTELNLMNSVPDPVFTIKYSYKDSFEAAVLFNESSSDKKFIYSAYFEKKIKYLTKNLVRNIIQINKIISG